VLVVFAVGSGHGHRSARKWCARNRIVHLKQGITVPVPVEWLEIYMIENNQISYNKSSIIRHKAKRRKEEKTAGLC
jgi:leucyl-tRNA synthetase